MKHYVSEMDDLLQVRRYVKGKSRLRSFRSCKKPLMLKGTLIYNVCIISGFQEDPMLDFKAFNSCISYGGGINDRSSTR